jgi:hypothetical protein
LRLHELCDVFHRLWSPHITDTLSICFVRLDRPYLPTKDKSTSAFGSGSGRIWCTVSTS